MCANPIAQGLENGLGIEARFEAFRERGTQILERIAMGAAQNEILAQIITLIEEQAPGAIATILVMHEDGKNLKHCAAPSLPPAYAEAVKLVPIGPVMGSCGTAAFTRKRVIVPDLNHSPLWDKHRSLIEPFGLRACWSEPILNGQGKVLGTFGIYHRQPAVPTDLELQISRMAAHLVGIALERDHREQERRNADQQLAVIERKLIEAQKLESLGVLAGGIAHDFNNLLTAILGYSGLIRNEVPDHSPACALLDGVNQTALRAADLCKQMLAYAGRGRFIVQLVNLSELTRDSERLLHLSISKKASLSLELMSDLPVIKADVTQMRQILMNLVINASEAMGDRAGRITVRTGLLQADREYLDTTHFAPDLPEGTYVTLEVTDTGCGMDLETQARIFDPFFSTKFTGRGLGLAAALGIVRGHKGALKVYSELGRGSTLKLLLPAVEGKCAPEQPQEATSLSGKGSVLVVDDETAVRNVTAHLLRSFGFDVITAADGREAIEIFRTQGPALRLVLLDLTMPNMDGEETFREMRLLDPQARVLLMSGFTEQEATAHFTGKCLAGFLPKPYTVDILKEKLAQALDGQAVP
jgi:signal transduction histidine kinase/CheY-like chemotaxis protein